MSCANHLIFTAALLVGAARASAQCSTFHVDGGSLDLSPLQGFVEVCARDKGLCATLTSGYPPSVKTVGYFVLEKDWQRYVDAAVTDFSEYLIAQRARRMTSAEFEDFKRYVRDRQGEIPDNTNLPAATTLEGQVSLGIVSETPDSVVIGTITKMRVGPSATEVALVASNIALQLQMDTLSLYIFLPYRGPSDVERLKEQSAAWASCLRERNG